MYYVDIDWANEKHDICILDAAGTVVKQFIIVHSLAGFQQLERQVLKRGIEQVQLNIERSDGLYTHNAFTTIP
jgi:hypothetical protein